MMPKPMLPIGERPILWHIMKIFAAGGCTEFVLALGWLGDEIKRYFLDYQPLVTDFTVELGSHRAVELHGPTPEDGWRVRCVDTGLDSLTGTRVRIASQHLGAGPVLVTYGDSVGSVNIKELLKFHASHGRLATVTAVRPPGRFGELVIDGDGTVREFAEKPQTSAGSINGGFMVLDKEAIEQFIPDDDVMLEREPMSALAAAGQLVAFEHDGFWQPMDTPRERELLEHLWLEGGAPWRVWE